MKYYLIAGEASGDLHASNLMRSLREEDKEADFRYFGGDLMQSVGGVLVKHYREMAYMGFIPVLMHLRSIFRNMDLCQKDIEAYCPDKVIFIDYPGFNLKVAKYLKTRSTLRNQCELIYYISPKVWAWKEYRVASIKKYIDRMLCILPFETDFYKKHNYPIQYVGNPTVDAVAEFVKNPQAIDLASDKPLIALLAGSRKQEIKDNLPVMLESALLFKERFQLVIAGAPGIDPAYYDSFIENQPVQIVYNQTYALLYQASVALVTSGTATLETALFRVPQVVCYKTPIKHIVTFVFEHLFSCKYISLVNLIADKPVVKELFGKYFSKKNIQDELSRILGQPNYLYQMLAEYERVIQILGTPGASRQAAKAIVSHQLVN